MKRLLFIPLVIGLVLILFLYKSGIRRAPPHKKTRPHILRKQDESKKLPPVKEKAAPKGSKITRKPEELEDEYRKLVKTWRKLLVMDPRRANLFYLSMKPKEKELIPYFKELAKNDKHVRVRSWAVRALGMMRMKSLKEFFIEILKKDKAWNVRYNCVWSLGELKDESLLPVLEQVSVWDESEKVKKKALEAIKKIKGGKDEKE